MLVFTNSADTNACVLFKTCHAAQHVGAQVFDFADVGEAKPAATTRTVWGSALSQHNNTNTYVQSRQHAAGSRVSQMPGGANGGGGTAQQAAGGL